MQEFQAYLEQTIETKPVIDVEEEKKFLAAKGITGRELIQTPEPPKTIEHDDEIDDNRSYSDSFESTDTEQETITEMGKAPGTHLPKFNSRRRESIEDVDGWFNNHLDLEQKKSEVCGMREGHTVGPTNYDTSKIFPFGRVSVGRRDSMSDEFFSESPQTHTSVGVTSPLAKQTNEVVVSDESAKHEEAARPKGRSQRSPDHSSLLKFLEKESHLD